MLSRVAENIFWLGRYLERAEDTARLLQATSHVQLDLPKSVRTSWLSLVEVFGEKTLFSDLYEVPDERSVSKFLISDDKNPGSILSSLTMARENARTIRDILPQQAWELINGIYQYAKDESHRGAYKKHRHDVLEKIVAGTQSISGALYGTLLHDAGYQFLCMGWHLERADMTTRIIDIRTAGLIPIDTDQTVPFENLQWMSVLKSVSGYENYRRHTQGPITHKEALSFLFKATSFPRSVGFCLHKIEHCAWGLKKSKPVISEIRSTRILIDETNCSQGPKKLHRFIDDLQKGFHRIDNEITKTFFNMY